MKKYRMGVLVFEHKENDPPFHEEAFYRQLCKKNNMFDIEMFVFAPTWVRWPERDTIGYTFDQAENRWIAGRFPLPELIYDRSFYRNYKHVHEKRKFNIMLRLLTEGQYLGQPIQNKWDVYRVLKKNRQLHRHLPYTELLRSFTQLKRTLVEREEAIIKPVSGSHGKGVLHLKQTENFVKVRGRNAHNEIVQVQFDTMFQLFHWLKQIIGNKKYCLQSSLTLMTSNNEPFDVRVLAQKNRFGKWQLTGSSIRLGQKDGVTSNLHGGGIACETFTFLRAQFGTEASAIWEKVESVCEQVPSTLEAHYGRLVELGIDIGIDQQRKIWILEVNAKPGRSAFRHHHKTHEAVILQPVLYAKYLLKRQFRRVSQ